MGVDYSKPIIHSGQKVTICGHDTHGANVVISYISPVFRHMRVDSTEITQPRVELFPDGVRIGCTFVTKDALEKIASEYASFLVTRSKVLQA